MEAFNVKVMLGFLLTLFLSLSVCCGAAVQEVEKNFVTEDKNQNNYQILKNFVEKIKTRISFGKDVAVYKWVNGEPILDTNREKFVLINVEETAKKLNKQFGDEERLFFIDLMEATKLIEYGLVSEWYAQESNGNTPRGSVSLDETRKKISAMQEDLIHTLYQLNDMKNSKACQRQLAKAIFETKTNNELQLRALQRAFGNFCKENIDHKS